MQYINPFIIIPLVAWFVAHTIKFLHKATQGSISLEYFYKSGGMPSAHSAVVSSLAVVIGIYEGVGSPLFGIVAVFAAVVIYDSFGVRRLTGEQGQVLNLLIQESRIASKHQQPILSESLGHRPIEVVAGGLLGITTGLLLTAARWIDSASLLMEVPKKTEQALYFSFFSIITLLSIVLIFWLLRKKNKKLTSSKAIKKLVMWTLLPIGLLGLLTVIMQNQLVRAGSARLWSLLLILMGFTIQTYLWFKKYSELKNDFKVERIQKQLQKKAARRIKKRKKR